MTTNVVSKNPLASTAMIVACGIWLVSLGLNFIVCGHPGLQGWGHSVFMVMGGLMAGAGVRLVFVASVAMPARPKGTAWALAQSGALTVASMSAANFALDSDYKWLLLAPALVWLTGLVWYVARR